MEPTPVQILPDSFEDFMKDVPDVPPASVEETPSELNVSMESRFSKERIEWTAKIKELSTMMKQITEMSALMTTIYTDRQRAVEYHYYLLTLLIKINKTYRKQYADKYDYYTYKSQKRFPNERNKEIQIMSELGSIISTKENLENHQKFLSETIKSIDNIIFGIKNRIDVENIMNGR